MPSVCMDLILKIAKRIISSYHSFFPLPHHLLQTLFFPHNPCVMNQDDSSVIHSLSKHVLSLHTEAGTVLSGGVTWDLIF